MPFKNSAQARACWAQYSRDKKAGKTPKWNCHKWAHETASRVLRTKRRSKPLRKRSLRNSRRRKSPRPRSRYRSRSRQNMRRSRQLNKRSKSRKRGRKTSRRRR